MYRPRDLDAYTKYGFKRNVYVYRGVMILADAIAGINWRVYKKGATGLRGNAQREAEVNNHPLADLLATPNPDESRFDFLERAIAYWHITSSAVYSRLATSRSRRRAFVAQQRAEHNRSRRVHPIRQDSIRPHQAQLR